MFSISVRVRRFMKFSVMVGNQLLGKSSFLRPFTKSFCHADGRLPNCNTSLSMFLVGVIPWLLVLTAAFSDEGLPTIAIDAGDNTGYLHAYASQELEKYLGKMFLNPISATPGSEGGFQVILGTCDGNPRVAEQVQQGAIRLPEGKNADQGFSLKSMAEKIYITGNEDIGVLYGIYTFLESYGAYFQITGERIPPPVPFFVVQLDQVTEPIFKYRGLLPWENFLCGIAGYNLEDYKLLVERAVRLKFNMLQFHFGPGTAFFSETINGERIKPNYLATPVDYFPTESAIGKGAFGEESIFGARPYVENLGNPDAQADAMESLMREVLNYAKALGMKTVVGFELLASPGANDQQKDEPGHTTKYLNPLNPGDSDITMQRYQSLAKVYPQSDYYWFWQPQGYGMLDQSVDKEVNVRQMREKYSRWTSLEAHAADIDYAYHFKEFLLQLPSEKRATVATAGWFIQHLFPGIHPDFPPEVTFASLNIYDPSETVNKHLDYYNVAKQGRPTWMIDWWEFSGEQWFPQWRVTWQEVMYRKCMEYDVEGVSLAGSKLSGVEHNIRYLADFTWNPSLTVDTFYSDYVQRLYGQDAIPIKEIFLAYDTMAPHIPPATVYDDRPMVLAPGEIFLKSPAFPSDAAELQSDTWLHSVKRSSEIATQQGVLFQKDRESIATIGLVIPGLDEQGQRWAALLLNRLRSRAAYLEAMIALNSSYAAFHAEAAQSGIRGGCGAALTFITAALQSAQEAVEIYAKDVRNRNDLGVIAQMNVQLLQPLRELAVLLGNCSNQQENVQ